MSMETARSLDVCRGVEERQRAVVDDLKEQLVESLVAQARAGFTAFAKEVAIAQPWITRKLGDDDVRALQAEIAAAVGDLAIRVRDTVLQKDWPLLQSNVGSANPFGHDARDLGRGPGCLWSAVSTLFDRELGELLKVLRATGFKVSGPAVLLLPRLGDPPDQTQRLSTRQLYDPAATDIGELLSAFAALAAAEKATAAAKVADDRDAATSLWG